MADNFTQSISRQLSKISLRVALLGVLVATAIAAGVVYFQSRSASKTAAAVAPLAARVEQVEGNIGVASVFDEDFQSASADNADAGLDWEEATRNTPLVAGDRIYADDGARATVAFTGRNYARLDSGSALDVLTLADRRTQLALRDGSALFDLGELADGELFEVATPNGAFGLNEPGLYQVGIGDDGNSWIAVLSGLAQVVGLAGSGEVSRGEILTLAAQAAGQLLTSRLAPDYAGGIIDDYYGYRYPDAYDGRYRDYDVYLDDPYYYDPYRRSTSYEYLSLDVPGVYDLDSYGDWRDVDGYGRCWIPRVDDGWAPYRNGYWDADNVYGPTWVSSEPWGWTPYHYGRWAYANNSQWCWVPDRARRRPVYSPALVAFVPITQSNQIGWVPLAPGEAYVPRYYDRDYRAQYYASPEIVNQVVHVQHSYVNARYPQAYTVVPAQHFTQHVAPHRVEVVNPQFIAGAQPTLDPYSIRGFRRIAAREEGARRRFKMERAFARQVFDTPVVTSAAPVVVPGRTIAAESLHVATVPERQRRQKIRVQESGQVVSAPQRSLPTASLSAAQIEERNRRIAELSTRATQGDRAARREMKQLRRQQAVPQTSPSQQPVRGIDQMPRVAPPSVRLQPNGKAPVVQAAPNPRKAQRQLERQQRRQGLQPQPQAQQAQQQKLIEQQRQQMNRQAQRQQMQQQRMQKRAAPQPQTVQPAVNPRKAQRQAERQQRRVQQPTQQAQYQQGMQQQQSQQQQLRQRQAQQQQMAQQQQQALKQQRQQQRQMQRQQQQAQQQQVINQQRQAQQQQMQQRQAQQQQMMKQRQMQQQQMRQPRPAPAQPPVNPRKAERQAARQQRQQQVVTPQPYVVAPSVAPRQQPVNPAKAQRQAERQQRKGGGKP